jgi:hypothetical protein
LRDEKFNIINIENLLMVDVSNQIYVTGDGEEIPVTELAETGNIQEKHPDWFKQDDICKRHMCLSYLPNDVSPADIRALAHADGVERFETTMSNRSDGTDSAQTTLLAAQMSAQRHMMEDSKVDEKARAKILSDLADEIAKQVGEITVQASVLFLIAADSNAKLEKYTTDIREKANDIGVDVATIEASPENKIIAMNPKLPTPKEIIEDYCISVDAATAAMMQMIEPPKELLDELYEENKDPIYLL